MAKFGQKSIKKLNTCHPNLITLLKKVVKEVDCTILEGYRNEEDQNKAYKSGNSTKKYPNGKHNKIPSIAVDVAPYPVDWDDRDRFHYFAGYVLATGLSMGMRVRWGGDWNMNHDFKDNNFDDLVHFEYLGAINEVG